MKKLMTLALLAVVGLAHAQVQARSKAEIDRAFEAQSFAKALLKAAAPVGKTLTGKLYYVNEKQQWFCSVQVSGQDAKASATMADPTSPERACVLAVLALSKQKAI